ncbi:MAG: hypothetical protein IPP90_23695 [Gemmatimonadaceae bacterium]|nr:hypothetical protein [Gemmatimonadaceae bacterium]
MGSSRNRTAPLTQPGRASCTSTTGASFAGELRESHAMHPRQRQGAVDDDQGEHATAQREIQRTAAFTVARPHHHQSFHPVRPWRGSEGATRIDPPPSRGAQHARRPGEAVPFAGQAFRPLR